MSQEQRRYRRFPVALPVAVGNLELETANLSLSGAQLCCADMIYGLLQRHLKAPPLRATIALSAQGRITVRCTPAYASQYGGDWLIGVHFEAFEEADGRERLRAFVIEQAGEAYAQPQSVG